jgi:uncharacterized membrane protein YkvA (DUF1232 family)
MRVVREMLIVVLGAFALIYLLMPSLLPDFIPAIGWIDEGIATTILLSVIKHYGLDLTGLFGRDTVQIVTESKTESKEKTPDSKQPKTKTVRIPRAVLEQAMLDYQRQQQSGANS